MFILLQWLTVVDQEGTVGNDRLSNPFANAAKLQFGAMEAAESFLISAFTVLIVSTWFSTSLHFAMPET
jgi:hypothetical protein